MAVDYLNNQALLLTTATIGILTSVGIYLYQKKKSNPMPTKWQPVGKVKELLMYPLKSGHRIELKNGNIAKYGIQLQTESGYILRDRCLVVYTEGNKSLVTARTYPKMVLIEVAVNKQNNFVISAPNVKALEINIPKLNKIKDWDQMEFWFQEKISTIDCGDEAAEWFSQFILGSPKGVRLGYHNDSSPQRRNISKHYPRLSKVYPNFDNDALGLYPDRTSYLLMNEASVDDLATRMQPDTNVSPNNFRANILVGDADAYAEDNWDWLKIGDAVLYKVKPCIRCAFTTVDPETGVGNSKNEILKTLKSYRKVRELTKVEFEGDEAIMGVNLAKKIEGRISVGDTVFVGQK